MKCRPAVGRRHRALVVRKQGLVIGPVAAHRARRGRRCTAVTASRRVRRWLDRAPARERKMKGLCPLLRPYVKHERRVRQGSKLYLRCRNAPYRPISSFLAGFTKARQCEPSIRLCSVASIAGSLLPRPIRRPVRRAAMTLLSLTHQAVAGAQLIRQVADGAVVELRRLTGPHHQEPCGVRGAAGRRAMRSAGRSKSKRSVRMTFLRHARHSGPAEGRPEHKPRPGHGGVATSPRGRTTTPPSSP